jgi:hypothetical protein
MRNSALRGITALAWTVPVLVIVQAAMIGQTLYGGSALIALHGSLGNLTFLLAASVLAMAWIARLSGTALLLTFGTVLLLFAQIGTGYLGHRYGINTASAVHVTLGVSVAVLAAAAAMRCGVDVGRSRSAAGTDGPV